MSGRLFAGLSHCATTHAKGTHVFVALKLTLPQDANTVWDALRDPTVFRAVSAPLLSMSSRESAGFPQRWDDSGPHRIQISLLGKVPVGEQTIDISFAEHSDGTRILTDAGQPQSGSLTVLRDWRHRMAVTPLPDGRSLYRDRLDFDAGWLSAAAWVGLWAFWQWRAFNFRRVLHRR